MKRAACYITLRDMAKMYWAFKFAAARVKNKNDLLYLLIMPDGKVFSRNCLTFGDFVDLHTKQSGLYRIY